MGSRLATLALVAVMAVGSAAGSNLIIRDRFTADPAPLVVGDKLYLYVDHDEAQRDEMFTIHPGLVQFKDDWYIFLHNADLAVGDQSGAVGRRAVTVERPHYNPDGTLKPVVQTKAGITAPAN